MVPLVTSTELTIASVEFRTSHPKLHHYTARYELEGIVQSNSLWATRYRDLNDSAEIVHLKEPFASALAPRFDEIVERQKLNQQLRMLYEKGGGSSALARSLVDSLYAATFEGRGLTAVEAFVVSFCTHGDDCHYEQENGLLSQWRGYSGQDGYCLVFDTAALCALLGREFDSRYWVHLQMDAVRYAVDGVSLDTHFPSLVGAAVQSLQQVLNRTPNPELGVTGFLTAATLLKHQGFREEREVRITAIPGTAPLRDQARFEHAEFPDLPLPQIRNRPQSERRYIPLFDGLNVQLPIERVIVGPSRNLPANAAFAKELLGSSIPVTCSATPWLPSLPAG
jgi:hypothetical protein